MYAPGDGKSLAVHLQAVALRDEPINGFSFLLRPLWLRSLGRERASWQLGECFRFLGLRLSKEKSRVAQTISAADVHPGLSLVPAFADNISFSGSGSSGTIAPGQPSRTTSTALLLSRLGRSRGWRRTCDLCTTCHASLSGVYGTLAYLSITRREFSLENSIRVSLRPSHLQYQSRASRAYAIQHAHISDGSSVTHDVISLSHSNRSQ